MDPITHGLLGGVVAQATAKKNYFRMAAALGAVAGMLPDLDLLLNPSSNPLLSWEYHRHFSHSLIFIPVGGSLAGFFIWILGRRRYPLTMVLWAAIGGYATHGFLDACTSYGTLLYWPFSQTRVFSDAVPIISPLYTFILFLGFLATVLWRRRWPAFLSLGLIAIYMTLGWVQHENVLDLQKRIAGARGHDLERGRAMPTPGNILLWRSLYESDGKIYVDAIRAVPWGAALYWEGGSVEKFNDVLLKNHPSFSKIQGPLERFSWFADGYLAPVSDEAQVIGDLRFSVLPTSLTPLWGIQIQLEPGQEEVQKIRFSRSLSAQWGSYWKMVTGKYPAPLTVP